MTLGQVYRKRYPPGKAGDTWSSMTPTGMANPPNDVFLTTISDDRIVLVARHPWFRGRDGSFMTYNGPKGTIQIRATLTEKGLQYDTEN